MPRNLLLSYFSNIFIKINRILTKVVELLSGINGFYLTIKGDDRQIFQNPRLIIGISFSYSKTMALN